MGSASEAPALVVKFSLPNPIAHPPQVLLPRTGGRLVLATDGVWSQAAGRALTAMWQAPLKTAAHEVIKGLAGRTADASIIVADVLPPKTSFQDVCKKQEALASRGVAPAGGGGIAGISKGAGQAVMRVLKLGRCAAKRGVVRLAGLLGC